MRNKLIVAGLVAAALTMVPGARAQVFTPTYQSPVSSQDIGLYLFDAGSEVGVEGMLRRGLGGGDLGLRVGYSSADEDVLLLGADYRNPFHLPGAAPLSLAFTVGAQAALLDADAFGVQGGVSVGYTFSEVKLTPYIHPRLALTSANDDTNLDVEADLGFDLDVTNQLQLRLGINLGDGPDWGVGLAFKR